MKRNNPESKNQFIFAQFCRNFLQDLIIFQKICNLSDEQLYGHGFSTLITFAIIYWMWKQSWKKKNKKVEI